MPWVEREEVWHRVDVAYCEVTGQLLGSAYAMRALGFQSSFTGDSMTEKKKKSGLYANIHAKQERIAHGSGEKMRKPGSAGAPSEAAFAAAAGKKGSQTAGKTTRKTGKKTASKVSGKSPRKRATP